MYKPTTLYIFIDDTCGWNEADIKPVIMSQTIDFVV